MVSRRRKFYAWGWEDEGASADEVRHIEAVWGRELGVDSFDPLPPPALDELDLPCSRIERIPHSIRSISTTDRYERALHTYGGTLMETARMFARDFQGAPDLVVYARDETDIANVLDWCGEIGAAAIPFGGGSSAVHGVNPDVGDGYTAVITIDLSRMNRVLEVDVRSRAARVQAGVFGPALDAQLKAHGLALRFFLQSFQFSSLGGWIATRAGGHYATRATHIDDFVESLRMVTPSGAWETRRVPASGAGPSPDRLAIGSEGSLGIITEAWLRLPGIPRYRLGATVAFDELYDGAEAVREIAQSGLAPSNCRLVDAKEASLTGSYDGTSAILVLGFESPHHAVGPSMAIALDICRSHRGIVTERIDHTRGGASSGAMARWRHAFLRECYYREVKTARGIGRDTCETSIPWSRFEELHETVKDRIGAAIREATGRPGTVTCRFTHVYADGPAPYFTYHFLADKSRMVEQAMAIKRAAYDAMLACGGTITHHHAVGRLHMPWYTRQRPEPFGRVLAAAKRELDPKAILNPGVLVPL